MTSMLSFPRRALAFGAGAALLCWFALGQPAPAWQAAPALEVAGVPADVVRTVEGLRERALASPMAYELVEGLTTEVGPRLAGSPGEQRAISWAEQRLRALRFEAVRVEPFTIPFWERVSEKVSIIAPAPQDLVATALGGSGSTPEGGLEAEVVRFTSLEGLRAASRAQVAGKIVFIDEPTTRTQDGSGYGAGVAKRSLCAPVTQALGGVACLIRSVGTHSHRFAHQGGNARARNGAVLPAAAISPPDADQLSRLTARGPVRVRIAIKTESRDGVASGNVIAEVRGRERPDEIVLIGAHLDSWDQGTGALDDGAGVAIVTAAAKLIADLPRRPRRTIRVVLFGAEETGIHGAIAYAARHKDQLANHIVAAESDFGARKVFRFQTRFGPSALPAARAIQRLLAPLGIGPGDNNAFGGPDVTPLREAGVPVVNLAQNGWDYFDFHHTPNDTLDKIDKEELAQNVAAYVVFAYLAAEMDWDFRKAG
jgi:carboxypeptidase Q